MRVTDSETGGGMPWEWGSQKIRYNGFDTPALLHSNDARFSTTHADPTVVRLFGLFVCLSVCPEIQLEVCAVSKLSFHGEETL